MAHDGIRSASSRLRRGDGAARAELVLVRTWLRRCLPAEEAAALAVEVLDRAAGPAPGCLAAAPRRTLLQHLAVQAVLRSRGVL